MRLPDTVPVYFDHADAPKLIVLPVSAVDIQVVGR